MDFSKFKTIRVDEDRTDYWFNMNQNVLLFGPHGIGKTAVIQNCFEKNGLEKNKSYMMFSGATLDPWTDFIGIPKTTKENGEEYIEYIRPKNIDENLEAIFMDEFNRTEKPVRNALMELIQFKSINGKAFPNLKVVWAACNPDDEDEAYDVERLDFAQGDRFHIIVNMLPRPDSNFFTSKFGPSISSQALAWWDDLPEEAINLVSPRRLEYCLDYHIKGGDISEMLPVIANSSQLKKMLKESNSVTLLNKAIEQDNYQEIKKLINNENHYEEYLRTVFRNPEYYNHIATHLKEEKLIILLLDDDNFFLWATKNQNLYMNLRNALKEIYESIDDESKADQSRLAELKLMFDNSRTKNGTFIVANPKTKRIEEFAHMGSDSLNLMDKKICSIQDLLLNKKSKVKSWNLIQRKLNLYMFNPKNFNKDRFYNWFMLYSLFSNNITDIGVLPQSIEYLNELILEANNKNILNDDIYFNILGNITNNPPNGFIGLETESVDTGDTLLLNPKEVSFQSD